MPTKSESAVSKQASSKTKNQSHITLVLPMISPGDGEQVRVKLKSAMPDIYRAADEMGTIHYLRAFELNVLRFVLLAEYDGDFDAALADFAKYFGPSFDAVMPHVKQAPPAPVADNVPAFVEWAKAQCLPAIASYEAVPATVKKIKSLAAQAGITLDTNPGPHRPLLVIMPMRSVLTTAAAKLTMAVAGKGIYKGADNVGTVHFSHMAQFSDFELGFFTVYDGDFVKYIHDFAAKLGPAFDLLGKFVIDPPRSPVEKYTDSFLKWSLERDWCPIGFYNAYPGLSVQDVKNLLANE